MRLISAGNAALRSCEKISSVAPAVVGRGLAVDDKLLGPGLQIAGPTNFSQLLTLPSPRFEAGGWSKREGRSIILIFVALILLTGCNPQRFFYYPNNVLYQDPDRLGIRNQVVHYPSLNGKTLYAVYFPAEGTPKGTVVHFHGNFGNVSNHFPLALFLVKRGFDVISFDYEGYGASEGSPSPDRMIEDGIASVRYAQEHLRNPKGSVFIFGQSLGAAVSIVVMAKEPEVKAAVLESPFASYRSQGSDVVRRHWLTWPLYLLVPFLNHKDDPIRFIGRIAPRPLFLIHGDADRIVSVKMSQRLYAAAKEPKQLWIVPGAGHLRAHHEQRETYEKRISDFFESS
jgi:uncharacterized protein